MLPDWVNHAIWWQVYPLGFAGAPIRTAPDIGDRFAHLERWLDYAVELGASGLLLGPIFASTTHGYDTEDFWKIDPRMGSEADFDRFVQSCHARGLRVVLDGVFNHVGSKHHMVADVAEKGSISEFSDFLQWEMVTGKPEFSTFEGHGSLVQLRHDSDSVRDEITAVMKHWLARGADGWRLDAAYAVPSDFWAAVLPRVREKYPQAWFLGEVIHGDYGSIAKESTMDSITQYELWKAIWSSLVDRNYYELAASLERNNSFLLEELPLTFIGNHDVTRIASLTGPEGAVLALTVLMTVGGTPSIYYGDEHGYQGFKEERVGGDDDVRPRMPSTPAELGPFGDPMLRVYRELISFRRRHPWLTRSQTAPVSLDNLAFTYDAVSEDGGSSVRVHLDLRGGHSAKITDSTGQVLFAYSA